MNTENGKAPAITDDAPARVTLPPRTKNQLKASALADGLALKAKWKTLIPAAKAKWDKLHAEELEKVDGSVHRLAGLVQLRQQLSRDETDRQVAAFMAQHDSGA